MIIPPRLQAGQTIGICAPAGPVNVEKLHRGVARLGRTFEIRIADGIFSERSPNVPAYLHASDAARAAELNAMLADPDIRAIVLARGGYGLMRILDELDGAALVRDPKPIVGFSDATALLAWAHQLGVRGVHGPMGQQLADLSDDDVAYLITMLTEPILPGKRPWKLTSHGKGVHAGRIVPANLTMASMMVGTPWELPLENAIALFEEVGEKPYEIDRYLTQLTLTGALRKTKAVIVGDLVRCGEANEEPGAAERTMLERIHAFGLPAATGAPVGHGNRNEAVPFAANCLLDLDAGTIEITEAAVS